MSTGDLETSPPPNGRPSAIELYPWPTLSTSSPPEAIPGPAPRKVLLPSVGAFLDLTLDPSQDLLVCAVHSPQTASYSFHLLSMDGQPRQDVAKPILPLDVLGENGEMLLATRTAGRFLIQILEDVVACIVVDTEDDELDTVVAWNWRTGEELCRLVVPGAYHMPSFCLLTPVSLPDLLLPPSLS